MPKFLPFYAKLMPILKNKFNLFSNTQTNKKKYIPFYQKLYYFKNAFFHKNYKTFGFSFTQLVMNHSKI